MSAQTPTTPNRLTTPDQPHISYSNFTRFSSLPIELRQEIWKFTFTPRVLCLHIHHRLPPNFCHGHENSPGQVNIESCVSFTATTLRSFTSPDEVFRTWARSPEISNERGSMSFGGDQGPVALYVCQESRALAMERYKLAFAGTGFDLPPLSPTIKAYAIELWGEDVRHKVLERDEQEWNRRRLWEKRIWIDYDQDIVFLDTMERRRPTARRPYAPLGLELIKLLPREEVKRIKKLAVGNGGSNAAGMLKSMLLPTIPATARSRYLRSQLSVLESFTALRELWLDDSFEATHLSYGSCSLENKQLSKEAFQMGIVNAWKQFPKLPAMIPDIWIVRGREWHRYGTEMKAKGSKVPTAISIDDSGVRDPAASVGQHNFELIMMDDNENQLLEEFFPQQFNT